MTLPARWMPIGSVLLSSLLEHGVAQLVRLFLRAMSDEYHNHKV
jgi:hypothetical protein